MRVRHIVAVWVVLILAAVVVMLAGNRATADTPIAYAVAGDSLSANSDSWLHQEADPSVSYVGGFQQAGYTTNGVLANIGPVPGAQVLVVMLGTNDVKYGVDPATIDAHIEGIVAKVGAPHVLISFLPPSDITDDATTHVNRRVVGITENRELVALAAKHGWLYADPFSFQRAWTNAWGTGASPDGTHPSTVVSALVAQRMALYIRQASLAG